MYLITTVGQVGPRIVINLRIDLLGVFALSCGSLIHNKVRVLN